MYCISVKHQQPRISGLRFIYFTKHLGAKHYVYIDHLCFLSSSLFSYAGLKLVDKISIMPFHMVQKENKSVVTCGNTVHVCVSHNLNAFCNLATSHVTFFLTSYRKQAGPCVVVIVVVFCISKSYPILRVISRFRKVQGVSPGACVLTAMPSNEVCEYADSPALSLLAYSEYRYS